MTSNFDIFKCRPLLHTILHTNGIFAGLLASITAAIIIRAVPHSCAVEDVALATALVISLTLLQTFSMSPCHFRSFTSSAMIHIAGIRTSVIRLVAVSSTLLRDTWARLQAFLDLVFHCLVRVYLQAFPDAFRVFIAEANTFLERTESSLIFFFS